MTYSELCRTVLFELIEQGDHPPDWRDKSPAAQEWRERFIALLVVRGLEADWSAANEGA